LHADVSDYNSDYENDNDWTEFQLFESKSHEIFSHKGTEAQRFHLGTPSTSVNTELCRSANLYISVSGRELTSRQDVGVPILNLTVNFFHSIFVIEFQYSIFFLRWCSAFRLSLFLLFTYAIRIYHLAISAQKNG